LVKIEAERRRLYEVSRKERKRKISPTLFARCGLFYAYLELSGQGNGLLVRMGHAVVEVQPGFNPALLSDVVRTLAVLC